MKKISFIIIILFLTISKVSANELNDITENVEIKAKWYKEVKEETYYKKGEYLPGYIEDPSQIRYSNDFKWGESYCSSEIKNQEKRVVRKYSALYIINKIIIKNISKIDNIDIYYNNEIINYKLTKENESLIYTLDSYYNPENIKIEVYSKLLEFDIEFYYSSILIVSKHIKNESTITVDSSWNITQNALRNDTTINEIKEGPFREIYKTTIECAMGEIETYRYKITKVYYDDEYHAYVEGYTPDISDIKVFYKGEFPKEEVIKYLPGEEVIKYLPGETKIELVEKEGPKEIITKYIETSKECPKEIEYIEKEPIIEYEYITKTKIPKKIYIIIISLVISLVTTIIIMVKNMSNEIFN